MSHNTFDVAFDFVIGGHEYIEAVFLDDFKVFRGVYSPLIEDTLTQLASYHMSTHRFSTRDCHCAYLFMLYSTTAVSRALAFEGVWRHTKEFADKFCRSSQREF